MLIREARLTCHNGKNVVLLLNEMKIKESLVHDKSELKIIEFVSVGEVNDQLSKFEREASSDTEQSNGEITTHLLTIMVRGTFSD